MSAIVIQKILVFKIAYLSYYSTYAISGFDFDVALSVLLCREGQGNVKILCFVAKNKNETSKLVDVIYTSLVIRKNESTLS